MKAISIRQPYASLIVLGYKPVENRSWVTAYRGPILIHASATFSREDREFAEEVRNDLLNVGEWLFPRPDDLPRGGIIGIANLVGIISDPSEIDDPNYREIVESWFGGPYGWLLQNATPTRFIPHKGKLGLWEAEISAEELGIQGITP